MEQRQLRDLNLSQRLIGLLNCEYVSIADYLMADYLLKHFDQLEQVRVEDLASACFTSKSAVRRFCLQLGYENLTQLKRTRNRLPVRKQPDRAAEESFRRFWQQTGLPLPAPREQLRRAAELIRSRPYLYLMAPYEISTLLVDFQRRLLDLGRLAYILPNPDRHLGEISFTLGDAVCLVISPEGEYARSLVPCLRNQSSRNLLFSRQEPPEGLDWELYIPLTQLPQDEQGREDPAMNKYSILYLFDCLLEELSLF